MDSLHDTGADLPADPSAAGLKAARTDDNAASEDPARAAEVKSEDAAAAAAAAATADQPSQAQEQTKAKDQPKRRARVRRSHRHESRRAHGKSRRREKLLDSSESNSDSSDSSDAASDSEDSDSDDSADDRRDRRRAARKKRHVTKKSSKQKSRAKSSRLDSSDGSSESDSSSDDSERESGRRSKRKGKKSAKGRSDRRRHRRHGTRRHRDSTDDDDDDSSDESSDGSSDSSSGSSSGSDDDEAQEQDRVNDANKTDAAAKLVSLRAALEDVEASMAADSRRSKTAEKKQKTNKETSKRNSRKSRSTKSKLDSKNKSKSKTKIKKKGYKRVDQLWDDKIHDYRLRESAAAEADEFDGYVFTVRRTFDWENKYKHTVVDIKSKALRQVLQLVMRDVRGISLAEDKPVIDPNMLFLYLEELRTHATKTLKAQLKGCKRKKRRSIKTQISHAKVLVSYLDHDYRETKQTLYPMLEAGNITFDLLWALFKPNTIAYTATYGAAEHPRCFKVDYANRESSFMRGEWYCVEGRYLEYDGKTHGLGEFFVDVDSFKGVRKITSLATYPLAYHKEPDQLKQQLIERGKKFVSMCGMSYRFHSGLAFFKKKKTVQKVNINGRVMVDPAIFRRINPNYPISAIKAPEDSDIYMPGDDSACSDCDSDCDSDNGKQTSNQELEERVGYKLVKDPKKEHTYHLVEISVDADGNELHGESIEQLANDGTATEIKDHVFSDEELLIASPVVLGFAASEKLWLEFSIAGLRDIEWNEGAFDSLVLPDKQKGIVRALVESHKLHAAKTIDDVVQGKGRGLVSVLHGPPGTGKTLTAEGIAELLRCPLYMVSAGELGTQPDRLEAELQKILDIAHSWGAVLLLDEADVFLERREANDMHRNALVSIFLRLLEYFQGILFLTTNRVETFDEAFQSRIHIALRYGELAPAARRAVWKMFLDKVRAMEEADVDSVESVVSAADGTDDSLSTSSLVSSAQLSRTSKPITDADIDVLARRQLNGRQIKNAVRTAQALAVHSGERLTAEHVNRVLDVAESFERDLRGGVGWEEAMRCYT